MALWLLILLACDGGDWQPVDTADTNDTNDTNDTDDGDRGEVTGIGITPFNPTLEPAGLLQFRAEAVYENGDSETLYDSLSWKSSNSRVAEIDSSGMAIAGDPGTSEITVEYDDHSAKVTLTVNGAEVTLDSVKLSPDEVSLLVGNTAQVNATGTFSDASEGNIAGSCDWESDKENIAEVDSTGKITAVAVGTAEITARCEPLGPKTVDVTVEEDEPIDWPTPNLELSALTHTVLPSGDVEYSAKVRNTGTGYASGFWVDAILDSSSAPSGASPDADQRVPGLGAGDVISVVLTVIAPPAGTYSSWLVVDPIDEVTEQDEDDNVIGPESVTVAAPPTSLPDIVLTDFWGIADTTGTLWYIEIENQGDQATGAFYIDLWENPSDIPEAGPDTYGDIWVEVPSIDPGETLTYDFETNDYPLATGDWYSCVLVDSWDDIDEEDEDNNVDCQDVEVF